MRFLEALKIESLLVCLLTGLDHGEGCPLGCGFGFGFGFWFLNEHHKLSSPSSSPPPPTLPSLLSTSCTTHPPACNKLSSAHPRPSNTRLSRLVYVYRYYGPYEPHTFPCCPPNPRFESYSAGADTVGRRGTTIFNTPSLNSARMRAISASYPKLIRRSKWPVPREERNGSATTCNTRRLRVESVISSRWYPKRNVVRMYAVEVVCTVMCGP